MIEVGPITYYIGFGIDENNKTVAYIDDTFRKPFYVLTDQLTYKVDYANFIKANIVGSCAVTHGKSNMLRSLHLQPRKVTQFMVQSYSNYKLLVQYFKDNYVTCYETEIDPVTHFLNMNGLNHTGWIEINDYVVMENKLTTITEYHAPANSIKMLNINTFPDFRILSMDLETYSPYENTVPLPHNEEDVIRMIGTCMYYQGEYTKIAFINGVKSEVYDGEDYKLFFFDDEISMIDAYINYVKQNQVHIIIGFNHLSYDYSFLTAKYFNTIHNANSYSMLKDHFSTVANIVWSSSGFKNNDLWIVNSPGVIDVDVMQVCMKEQGFRGYSLNEISKVVLNDSKVDLDYGTMQKLFTRNRLEDIVTIADYCLYDCVLPINILLKKHMILGVMERASVERLSANDVYTKGAGMHMIGQLHFECYTTIMSRTSGISCMPDIIIDKENSETIKYKGATVLEPVPGLYNDCAVVDFSSLYPSIIIADNICYSTYTPIDKLDKRHTYNQIIVEIDREYAEAYYSDNILDVNYENETAKIQVFFRNDVVGIVPALLKKLIDKRNECKRNMKTCHEDEKPVWDKRQYAYKIAANSIYGLLGGSDPNLKFPLAAACVTSQGRMYLNSTVSLLNGIDKVRVVYGDTDSCFIKIDGITNAKQYKIVCDKICAYISNQYNNEIRLEFENAFKSLLIISKKSYAGMRYDGSFYYRGVVSVRRNSSKVLKGVVNDLLNMILNGYSVSDVKDYVRLVLNDVISGKMNVDDLKIGVMINDNSSSPQFDSLINHMNENGIVRRPRQLVYYVYVDQDIDYRSHTDFRRESSWVKMNNVKIDYEKHIIHELRNPIMKLLQLIDINIADDEIY